MWFVVKRINDTEKTTYDSTEVLFTVNKAVIFNEKEKIDGLVASEGMLSKQTILENHPYVDDVNEEQKRLDAEEQDRLDKNVVDLASVVPTDENGVPLQTKPMAGSVPPTPIVPPGIAKPAPVAPPVPPGKKNNKPVQVPA
jgi:predicted RNase H-like nuclease